MLPLEIAPAEVKRRLDAGEKLHWIDVRQPWERAIASIAGGEAFPMPLDHLQERARHAPLIVYCHHGVRSLNAVHWMREQGIENCQSMSGGIDEWSREIDPSLPRY